MGLELLYLFKIIPRQAIGNRPLLLFGILLVSIGVQLLTLGLLAELQTQKYHESQDKPTYVISEICESLPVSSPVRAYHRA